MARSIELKAPPGKAAGIFLIDTLREGVWPQGSAASVKEAIRRVVVGNRGRNREIEEYFVAYDPDGVQIA